MSEEENKPEDTNADEKHTEEVQSADGGGARKGILAIILLAVVGIGAYDFFVVRKAFSAASENLNTLQDLAKDADGEILMDDEGNTIKVGDVNRDGKITPDDVQQVIGKKPAETVEVDAEKIYERYSWRGITSHNVYVLYSKFSDKPVFYAVKNKKPDETMFRKNITTNPDAPNPSLGGGAPPASGDDEGGDDKKGDDSKGDDSKGDDSKGDDSKGDEAKGDETEGDEAKGDG